MLPEEATTQAITQAKNIHEAINNVMSRVGYVQKEQKSGGLKYSYASEKALIAAIRPEMVKERIIMYCSHVLSTEIREYDSTQGTKMVNVSITCQWTFAHAPSGTQIFVESRGEGSDSSDKANNKAMTGSMKYAMRQTFVIETGDDSEKDQNDERKSASRPIDEWPQAHFETLVAKGWFLDILEAKNAIKLSKVMIPGVTGIKGMLYWAAHYRAALAEGLDPKEAAENRADLEYLAEKARQHQDAMTEVSQ